MILPALKMRPLTKEEIAYKLFRETDIFLLDPSVDNEIELNNTLDHLKRAAKIEINSHLKAVENDIIVPLYLLKAFELSGVFSDEAYEDAFFESLTHVMQAAKAAVTPDECAVLRSSDEVQEWIETMPPGAVLVHGAPLAEFFYEPEQTEALVETINHHLKVLGVITRLMEEKLGHVLDFEGDDLRRLYKVDKEPKLDKPYHDDDEPDKGISR